MKKRILIIFLILVAISSINYATEFSSINPVITVGDEVYVQHDTNNNNVYDLQKSGTGITTIYKTILPEFTANKAWTNNGKFVDNISSSWHGATAPENYIPVVSGEEYFVKLYGVAKTGELWYAPVVFLNDNNDFVSDALTGTFSSSKSGVVITVPENATRMHFTMYNHQNFTVQKVLNLTDAEFDDLPINKTQLETDINQKYEQFKTDKIVYKNLDKAYITFVNDDTRAQVGEYADLFISKNIPLVLATIPEALIENASSLQETRLEVARRVEKAGGEIIAHNAEPLTQQGLTDYSTIYSFFVKTKQLFNYYKFDVNGIILSGGSGQVTGAQESEKWASSVYSYSDLYGVEYDKKEIALDSVFYHRRTGLGGYANNLDKIKVSIDEAIDKKSWLVFYFHDASEISTTILGDILDYVKSKNETQLECVTYKEMYQKNAVKESDIIKTKNTYYVSSNGTSSVGISESDPMNYETAQKKVYFSGDTILFKKGDTFYGTFNPTIAKVDDKVTTISSYGEGKMPNIVGYKIANYATSWQLHSNGIYKINLVDTQYFSGIKTVDSNSTNIGFLQDKDGKKYFNRKSTLSELENEYDFYCDGTYLYIKSDENPFSKLGELKLATKTNLLVLKSNLKIQNIKFSETGAHGLVGSDADTENVEISNNVIQNIGGSYLYSNGTTRYGNGIEFYGTNASNIMVKDNIIRNTYDVGFTIQGTKGSGKNIIVENNIFVCNSHDSEIWESGTATGVQSYEFRNNISVNAGRGWGHEARSDKYDTAHILFWGYSIENTDIYFHKNTVYNPRRIYFIEQTNGTDNFFKNKTLIKSDYNTYLLAQDAKIFRDSYNFGTKDDFINDFNKDHNSTFTQIEVDKNIVNVAKMSDNLNEIRLRFGMGEKINLQISGLTYSDKTYDGKIVEPSGTLKVENDKISIDELVILYEKYDGTNWNEVSKNEMNNAGKYRITYKISETAQYYKGSVNYVFSILKALPSYQVPIGLEAKIASKLSSVKLPEGFSWNEPEKIVEVGNKKYLATYTPKDVYNYEIVQNVEIEVKVDDEKFEEEKNQANKEEQNENNQTDKTIKQDVSLNEENHDEKISWFDNTIANKILPKTGAKGLGMIIILMIIFAISAVRFYLKYRKVK